MEEKNNEINVRMKKETLVLIVVALVFVGVLAFVIWDLSQGGDSAESYSGESDEDLLKAKSQEQVSGEGERPEPPSRPGEESSASMDSSTYESCIGNTKDEPECKNCCDCLDTADGAVRTACRDECAVSDFSDNSDFITVSAPSVLGLDGDYSECVALGGESECKSCCESSMELQCGDYRHCRTACNEAFG